MDRGFVDTHIHGAYGFDTSDGDALGIRKMAKALYAAGTTAFCPTTMTISRDEIMRSFEAVNEAMQSEEPDSAKILGVHLEGPILNPKKCGVQDSRNAILPKDAYDLIDEIETKFPGLLKIIDISPELEGGIDFIKEFSKRYVISLAHTAADYEICDKAFKAGATSVTHVLNATEPMLKRATGILGAAIDNDAFIEVIADGHHIHGSYLKLLYSDVLENRLITVSDSMRGAFMPDGTYDLGGIDVEVRGGRTYYGPNGDLAGSVTCLKAEYEVLRELGISEERIKKTMYDNPLKRLGIMR